ncbi:hypothetical protein NDU88_002910 [Pleurodeles waltl]|uniref:Uncharacterized protein n=1 Tax=Pleurodeles waltl TaxID=8319 RepID=A0AAV7V065_PLEWA|nr:hypothetical protein NDU88_002910 [Pleurodeles waltl]
MGLDRRRLARLGGQGGRARRQARAARLDRPEGCSARSAARRSEVTEPRMSGEARTERLELSGTQQAARDHWTMRRARTTKDLPVGTGRISGPGGAAELHIMGRHKPLETHKANAIQLKSPSSQGYSETYMRARS